MLQVLINLNISSLTKLVTLEVVGPWVADIGQILVLATAGDDAKDLSSPCIVILITVGLRGHRGRWKDFPNGVVKKGQLEAFQTILRYPYRRFTPVRSILSRALRALMYDGIAHKPVIINEIGNLTGDNNDWLELRNVSDGEVNL